MREVSWGFHDGPLPLTPKVVNPKQLHIPGEGEEMEKHKRVCGRRRGRNSNPSPPSGVSEKADALIRPSLWAWRHEEAVPERNRHPVRGV